MSEEFQDIKEAISRGRSRLVQKFPRLMLEASQAAEQFSDALGTPKEDMRETELRNSISAYAKDIGEDVTEMLIRYGASCRSRSRSAY